MLELVVKQILLVLEERTTNNDMFLVAPNPFASIPSYDGSLAFRWVDWPNKATGALPPYIAIHSEVEASFH